MTKERAIYELDRMKTWSNDLSDDEIEAIVIAIRELNVPKLNKWIGVEALDKIRSDISALVSDDPEDDYQYGYNDALMKAVHIIDRYKIEEVDL